MELMLWRPKLCLGIGIFCVGIAFVVLLLVTFVLNTACTRAPLLPVRLILAYDGDGVVVSWTEPVLTTNCNNSYLFRYSVDGGQEIEIATTSLSYKIEDVSLCSDVVLIFWTVSESGNLSDERLERNHTAIPVDASVSNLEAVETPEGVVVTWRKPAVLEPCRTSYRVRYHSELGDFSDTTDNESILVPQDIFCFLLEIMVANVVGFTETGNNFQIFMDGRNLNLKFAIPPEEPNVLNITWQHPSQEVCSMTYNVTFYGIGYSLATSKPEASINFSYCAPIIMYIAPIALDGAYTGPTELIDITQFPGQIEAVQYADVEMRDDALFIEWLPLQQIGNCNLNYLVSFSTELGNFTNETVEPIIEFSREFYCFVVQTEIRARFHRGTGEVTGPAAIKIIEYEVDTIEDLQLKESISDNTLTVTWKGHRLQEQCGLEYVVAYEYGSINETFTTNQTSGSIIRGYCATTTVRVRTVHGDAESKEAVETCNAISPPFLEHVSNVEVAMNATSAFVSWHVPLYLSQCSDLYTVIGENENAGQSETCTGTSGCGIIWDHFCPQTIFTIKPTSIPGDPVSTEPISCLINL